MMWWHGDWNAWAWLAMSFSMIAFWGLLIWGVVTVVRGTGGALSRSASPPDPDQILRERLARGEIDIEEFERRRDVLRRDASLAQSAGHRSPTVRAPATRSDTRRDGTLDTSQDLQDRQAF